MPANMRRRAPKKVAQDEQHSKALEALKARRDKANPQRSSDSPAATRALSGGAINPDFARITKKASHTRRDTRSTEQSDSSPAQSAAPQSTMKVRGTPGGETSMLALANFRRRPRQPSILQMVQQPNSGGVDDLEDFTPEDESTPLQLTKGKKRDSTGSVKSTAQSTLAYSDAPADHAGKKRRISPTELQVPGSSPPPEGEIVEDPGAQDFPSDDDDLPEQIPETQSSPASQREEASDMMSGTMAEPRSTDSSQDQHIAHEEENSESQPRKGSRRKAPALSTAALQSMLPRRRHEAASKVVNEFDLPPSDQGTSDAPVSGSESATGATRNRRKTTARPPATNARSKSKKSFQASESKKSQPTTKSSCDRVSRTYGKRSISSDKENNSTVVSTSAHDDEDDGEDSTLTITGPSTEMQTAELKEAAKKFAEIDQWEMTFESVDPSSSSPWR